MVITEFLIGKTISYEGHKELFFNFWEKKLQDKHKTLLLESLNELRQRYEDLKSEYHISVSDSSIKKTSGYRESSSM